MIPAKMEYFYTCPACRFKFSNFDVPKSCGNCFACTGCEIYLCPSCQAEVVIKPVKSMKT